MTGKIRHDLEQVQREVGMKIDKMLINEDVKGVIEKLASDLEAAIEQHTPQIGDRVCVAHWSDFDPNDAVEIGTLSGIKDSYYYIEGNARGWRYCKVLFRAEAEKEEKGREVGSEWPDCGNDSCRRHTDRVNQSYCHKCRKILSKREDK